MLNLDFNLNLSPPFLVGICACWCISKFIINMAYFVHNNNYHQHWGHRGRDLMAFSCFDFKVSRCKM